MQTQYKHLKPLQIFVAKNNNHYYGSTYIGELRRGRRLQPHALWNMNIRVQEDLPRTNNDLEWWHTRFSGGFLGDFYTITPIVHRETKTRFTAQSSENGSRSSWNAESPTTPCLPANKREATYACGWLCEQQHH